MTVIELDNLSTKILTPIIHNPMPILVGVGFIIYGFYLSQRNSIEGVIKTYFRDEDAYFYWGTIILVFLVGAACIIVGYCPELFRQQ